MRTPAVLRPALGLIVASVGLCALALPNVAVADEVVVPPLVPRGATKMREVANISQLLASELDFMREVERVIALDSVPQGYGYACLDKGSCLRPIGQKEGGTHLLAGSLRVTEANVTLDLVYFSVTSGRYVRRQSFELPNTPEVIADNMGDIAREMVTGETPKDDAAADESFSLMDFDDEFDVDFDKDDFEEAAGLEAERKAAEEERRRAEAERRRKEEEARLAREAEERRKAEEAARRKAEEERRRREEEERRLAAEREAERKAAEEERRRAEAERRRREEEARVAAAAVEEEPEPDFDPNAISFGSAAIIVEEEPEPEIVTEEPDTLDYYEDDEEPILDLDDAEPVIADLDDPDVESEPRRDPRPDKVKPERVKPQRPQRASAGFDDTPTMVSVALRGGYSPYYNLGFITYGGEVQVAAADTGIHVLGGLHAYTVQRDVPEAMQQTVGAIRQWNTMYPVNLGAVYKVSVADGRVKPYGGADILFARYLNSPEGGSVAFGGRARGGVEVMIIRNVGVSADLAFGGWAGKDDWQTIEPQAKAAGLFPQVSAGTVIAF